MGKQPKQNFLPNGNPDCVSRQYREGQNSSAQTQINENWEFSENWRALRIPRFEANTNFGVLQRVSNKVI